MSFVFANHWQIDELIALGAVTAVYGVTHRRGRHGALKIELEHARQEEDQFLREVTLSDVASTAGSPELLAYGASDAARYLIHERVHGDTLRAHSAARDGRFDLATALLVTVRLASAVERLHALGIVHRDLEPSNVLITDYGGVTVIDFGRAARAGLEPKDDPCTPFAAPEQAERTADPLDPRGDVFSVGAILYWMLTGAVAPLERLAAGVDLAVSLEEIAHLPLAVIDLLDAALAREPHRRLPKIRSLRRGLVALHRDSSGLALVESDPNLDHVREEVC